MLPTFRRVHACRTCAHPVSQCRFLRTLLTLSIETSCDDTSVAIVEKHGYGSSVPSQHTRTPLAELHYLGKVTANSLEYRGIHPIVSLESHQENLAELVCASLEKLPKDVSQHNCIRTRGGKNVRKPDFISVTRGPGMRSNLSTGLDTAKGLAVAWQVSVVAVNHMQAHALTPRLVSAMHQTADQPIKPEFPFLSLLVSGGHTMLVHSKSLNDHPTLASTSDIAIGDAIDKIARFVLPQTVLESSTSTMYGPVLENFVFPNGASDYNYTAPAKREQELARRVTLWGWAFGAPLAETRSGSKSKSMEYSFTGTCSTVKRLVNSLTMLYHWGREGIWGRRPCV